MFSAAWDDEKSVIYLLLLLVQHGQNNYFFGRTKLEKIRYIALSICSVVVYYTLKYYMHGSLFFSKKTAVHGVWDCYMHGSLFFSKTIALHCILECYIHGSLAFL